MNYWPSQDVRRLEHPSRETRESSRTRRQLKTQSRYDAVWLIT